MKTYLKLEEVTLLEQAAICLRDKLLIRLLFRLGCRVSEALAITVGDIDFEKGLVTIIKLKSRSRLFCPSCEARLSMSHHFCPRCGNIIDRATREEQEQRRQRVLPLDSTTLKMLEDYIKRGGYVTKEGRRYLFGINRHRAWQLIKECAEREGLPRLINPETGETHYVSPHRLRDAFSVHAVKHDDSGDGLRLLQEHLGHVSFNTTAKYRKIAGEEHRRWYEGLWEKDKDAGTA